MIPDDDRMRRAMHSLSPEGVDAPDLFERVARGARHRRRMKTGGALFGVAAVVCAAAVVPAAIGGTSHHSSGQQVASGGIDPGFTGASPEPSQVAPTTPSPSPSPSFTAVPVPLPTDSASCPTVASLPPGPDAEAHAMAAALAAAPGRYGADGANAVVTSVYPASINRGYGIVADAVCGKVLGDNSYVVELGFGDTANANSASMGSGQLFVANFPDVGWQVWFQYH